MSFLAQTEDVTALLSSFNTLKEVSDSVRDLNMAQGFLGEQKTLIGELRLRICNTDGSRIRCQVQLIVTTDESDFF